jgi:hypothetical protein
MIYSDPRRESDPHALPNVEVFRHNHEDAAFFVIRSCQTNPCGGTGWYWWPCLPSCLPDGDPNGPFETEAEAIADAQGDNHNG